MCSPEFQRQFRFHKSFEFKYFPLPNVSSSERIHNFIKTRHQSAQKPNNENRFFYSNQSTRRQSNITYIIKSNALNVAQSKHYAHDSVKGYLNIVKYNILHTSILSKHF